MNWLLYGWKVSACASGRLAKYKENIATVHGLFWNCSRSRILYQVGKLSLPKENTDKIDEAQKKSYKDLCERLKLLIYLIYLKEA